MCVVTSNYGLTRSESVVETLDGVVVYRILRQYAYGNSFVLPPWTLRQASAELKDARCFKDLLEIFSPDVVCWWSLNGISKILLPIPARKNIPEMFWIEDPWMIREFGVDGEIAALFWNRVWDGAWGPQIARPFLKGLGSWWESRVCADKIPSRLLGYRPRHVCFVSHYLEMLYRKAGFNFQVSQVIHAGVSIGRFFASGRLPSAAGRPPLRLLYAGQLSRDRGLHTVIEALGSIRYETRRRVCLTVVGDGVPEYRRDLDNRASELGLTELVKFVGKQPHERMPSIFKEHDILIFPSTRDEGLPLSMVEAMLAGCAVVTTGSGGAMEIAKAASLPLFPANNAEALADLISRLESNRSGLRELAARGQAVALTCFNSERMIDKIEETLGMFGEKKPITTWDHNRGDS